MRHIAMSFHNGGAVAHFPDSRQAPLHIRPIHDRKTAP